MTDMVHLFCLENILNMPENEVMMPIESLDLDLVQAAGSSKQVGQGSIHPLARPIKDLIIPSPKAFVKLSRLLKHLCYFNNDSTDVPNPFAHAHDADSKAYVALDELQQFFNHVHEEEERSLSVGGFFGVIEYFVGAMAGLCSVYCMYIRQKRPNKRTDELKTKHQERQISMLANLVVMGPSAIFKASTDKEVLADWKGFGLIQFGAQLLQEYFHKNPEKKIPPHPFHKLRLHFMRFLKDMGFGHAVESGFPPVDWERVMREFKERFAMPVIIDLLKIDLELALEKYNTHDEADRISN